MSKKRASKPPRRSGRAMRPDSLVASIGEGAKGAQPLAAQAVAAYEPVGKAILNFRCGDRRHIEQTLEGLLGFCFAPNALRLYRTLCRHCYAIDPAATASYVLAYREMWDSEKEALP